VEQTRFGNVIKTNNRSESRQLTFNKKQKCHYTSDANCAQRCTQTVM